MITLKHYENGKAYTFKNWRVAHRELASCDRHNACQAWQLEHYSDMRTEFDDFGDTIGKDCLLELFELAE